VTTPPPADLLLLHARTLLTCAGPSPRRGPAQADAGAVPDGSLAGYRDRIVFAGPSSVVTSAVSLTPDARVFDLAGEHSIVPGLVDAHTHAAFAGDRRRELARRLAGETYGQIAASGGGILSTVSATRNAPAERLAAATRARLDEMLACGTTTCEIKSGYGLTTASELKMLEAIAALRRTHPMAIVPTFMGAHEFPPEYRRARGDYVDLVVNEMIPAVAGAGLAEWCDVFCEDGVFTPGDSLRVLRAGEAHGLKPRIHADELGSSGGSRVAAAVRARSADHLVFVSREDIRLLAAAGVTATLLPAAAFYLKLGRYAPARALIDAGVPVALATDVNPGGGLSPSMPFAMALACFAMDMSFEEALVAATVNAAWALDRADTAGSLEAGKVADLLVVRGDAVDLVRVGAPSVAAVFKSGALVHGSVPVPGQGALE
jgi:imidazolonepropionase